MVKPAAASEGRPADFKKTLQGKLEQALEVLKDRYARDFPAFLKGVRRGSVGAQHAPRVRTRARARVRAVCA